MSDKLKPCPFCDSIDIHVYYNEPQNSTRFFCNDCGIEVIFSSYNRKDAIVNWNTRCESNGAKSSKQESKVMESKWCENCRGYYHGESEHKCFNKPEAKADEINEILSDLIDDKINVEQARWKLAMVIEKYDLSGTCYPQSAIADKVRGK